MGATADKGLAQFSALELSVMQLWLTGQISADTRDYFLRPARIAALESELGIGQDDADE